MTYYNFIFDGLNFLILCIIVYSWMIKRKNFLKKIENLKEIISEKNQALRLILEETDNLVRESKLNREVSMEIREEAEIIKKIGLVEIED